MQKEEGGIRGHGQVVEKISLSEKVPISGQKLGKTYREMGGFEK